MNFSKILLVVLAALLALGGCGKAAGPTGGAKSASPSTSGGWEAEAATEGYDYDGADYAASGDSGGGIFIRQGHRQLLAGIVSFGWGALDGYYGDSDYDDVAAYTRVSVFNDWIDELLGIDHPGKGLGKDGGKGHPSGFTDAALGMTAAVVPEPSTLVLLGVGGLCLLGCTWRRRRKETE